MPDFARKPVESSRAFGIVPSTESLTSVDLANEKHYSVIEIGKLWALSQRPFGRSFEREPGVILWGGEETRHKRGYRTLRVPEAVLCRVHRRLRKAS